MSQLGGWLKVGVVTFELAHVRVLVLLWRVG